MRESELLAHIERRSRGLVAGAGWGVAVGPGDDAAVLTAPTGGRPLVVTVDQLVAGRHFDAAEAPVNLIARKAVARSISDLAAMGAEPAWSLATGLLPAGYPRADALFDAMARWATHWSCPLIGGDIAVHAAQTPGPLTLTVTAAGVIPSGHSALLRSGARDGDELWLSGAIGGSLPSGRHLSFEPRVTLGLLASRDGSGVRAAIDLSDGLGRDAARLGRASGVLVELDAAAVPLHQERAGDLLSACADGEDYELLLAIDPALSEALAGAAAAIGLPLTRIGRCAVTSDPGAVLLTPGGGRARADELGWEH